MSQLLQHWSRASVAQITLCFITDLQIEKKSETQIAEEEVNLSTFKWNFLNFFFFAYTFEPSRVYNRSLI